MVLEPRYIKSKIDSLKYLEERDEYRAAALKPACWVGANISLHHRLMGALEELETASSPRE